MLIRPFCLLVIFCLVNAQLAVSQTSGFELGRTFVHNAKKFRANHANALEALLQLGYEHQVCLGIESVSKGLTTQPVSVEADNISVADKVRLLLIPAKGFSIYEQDKVLLIQNTRVTTPTWLDFKIRNFKVRQGTVQAVSNVLFMQMVRDINPSPGGFAGTYRTGDTKNLIGPFNETGKTVRQLLNLIVSSSSKGGMWVAHRSTVDKVGVLNEPFWIILEYSQPMGENLSLLKVIVEDSLKSDVKGSPGG